MHPDLQSLFYKAEEHYLQPVEIKLLRHHLGGLAERLHTYELLREQEISLFQSIADQLQQEFSPEQVPVLEQALRQWLAVMRYAAMAMLTCNPEYLQRHLLEWLTDIVQSQSTQAIHNRLCQLLQARLQATLSAEQQNLILPLVDQARNTLLGSPMATSLIG
jgi:hypothetical protein